MDRFLYLYVLVFVFVSVFVFVFVFVLILFMDRPADPPQPAHPPSCLPLRQPLSCLLLDTQCWKIQVDRFGEMIKFTKVRRSNILIFELGRIGTSAQYMYVSLPFVGPQCYENIIWPSLGTWLKQKLQLLWASQQ